jgi:hypothetical protein
LQDPDEQHVGPFQPMPPHWPYRAEQLPEGPVGPVDPDEEVGVPVPLPPLDTCCDADPLPLQLSTAMT